MKIKFRLILGYLLPFIIAGAARYAALRLIARLQFGFDSVVTDTVPTIETLHDLKFAGLRIVSSTSEYGLLRAESPGGESGSAGQDEEDLIRSGEDLYNRSITRLETLTDPDSPAEVAELRSIRSAGSDLCGIGLELIALEKAGKHGAEIANKKEDFEKSENAFLGVLESMLAVHERELKDRHTAVAAEIEGSRKILLGFGLLALVAILAIALYVSRSISKPIVKLEIASIEIGKGNLNARVDIRSKDELGKLAESFNRMAADISGAERELVLAKHFTDKVIDSMANTLIVLNVDGSIKRVNRALLNLLGYEEGELIGRDYWLISNCSPDQYLQSVQQLIEHGSLTDIHREYIAKDGRRIPTAASAAGMRDQTDNTEAIILVAEDITQRRIAEEQTKKAHDLAIEAARLKSEFLANMSHEIRTPMNGVIGLTELTLNTSLNSEQREYLELVKTSADHLLTILNDILDFSKIEAGKLVLDSTGFQLRDSLSDAIKTLATRAHEKSLELAFQIAADVPDNLVGDPNRLRQVLINLVGNAIKFTEHGEVVTRVRPEILSEDQALLHFSVADTGIGIPLSKQKHIFDAFTQADGSMTRTYGGTGLGLAISSQLVGLMGGALWVESEVGKGSTFHFTIKLGLQKEAETKAPTQMPVFLEGLRALVVDDNSTNRLILNEMLSHWKMRVTTVASGPAALAAMEHEQEAGDAYRLVLLDLMMPEMNGFEVAEQIKARTELAQPTIMMLTSTSGQDDFARCKELRVSAYIIKPVTQSGLLQAIKTALGKQTAPSPSVTLDSRPRFNSKGARINILVVEDNRINQLTTTRMLEKRGYKVTVAENGRQALSVLETETIDLVLMDMQMPEMNGFEATAEIRKRALPGEHMPIIALTAFSMNGDRERCLAAGADAYISKPIHSYELCNAIESLLPTYYQAEVSPPKEISPKDSLEFSSLHEA